MSDVNLLEKDMEPLIQRIIVELKLEKTIDGSALASLNDKLSVYKTQIKEQNVIPRSFVGKLFYLFSTMVWHAQYVNYRDDIMLEVFRLRTCLLSVFDESNFG
ncbi:hypothetical protein [Paenibacillus sp. 481]|uniref:hypothetical protein n=1 Tax=Paenibacillus sp. 481 TaxID=2835869 RepID=UPI001E36B2A4|nr:hypothetical protein [Paenibacillus sp. 481]UHA73752.1 hypothetical protein KIK04_00835 [Paenibacillus sp. 481]